MEWIPGFTKTLPSRALSFVEKSSLVTFIENYAEQNAVLLPGRIPGYKKDDLELLIITIQAQAKRYTWTSSYYLHANNLVGCAGSLQCFFPGCLDQGSSLYKFLLLLEGTSSSCDNHKAMK